MWDTTEDPRILLAERTCRYFENILANAKLPGRWDRRGALEALKKISSKVQEMKFSYIPPAELSRSEMAAEIQKKTARILECLGGEGWAERFLEAAKREERGRVEEHISRIRFSLNILYNLPARLALGEVSEPAYAVDIRAGRILSASAHPGRKELTLCKVSMGRALTVITNVKGVEEGATYAISLLPPRRIGGVLSEGMFLGSEDGLLKVEKGEGELLRRVEDKYLKEVRREVLTFIRGD
ncbi:MAG: tRNA-binding protein [Thermoplasmata archaeon]|nr:MAG: tRNA-binding protein [Thermoplasmata archaeon]